MYESVVLVNETDILPKMLFASPFSEMYRLVAKLLCRILGNPQFVDGRQICNGNTSPCVDQNTGSLIENGVKLAL